MNILILSASPNIDGLTAACARAAVEGVQAAGHQAEELRLTDLDIRRCRACGNGWGTCREEQRCCQEDDFTKVQERFRTADAYILVTPVYFGEPSEAMKAFADRLRRCNHARGAKPSELSGKPIMAVAAAGGSGNGYLNCLACLERWSEHLSLRKFDFIGVTRFTRAYKLAQITQAAKAMISGV